MTHQTSLPSPIPVALNPRQHCNEQVLFYPEGSNQGHLGHLPRQRHVEKPGQQGLQHG